MDAGLAGLIQTQFFEGQLPFAIVSVLLAPWLIITLVGGIYVVSIATNLLPSVTGTWSVGSAAYQWLSAYIGTLNVGTIVPITGSGGTLNVQAAQVNSGTLASKDNNYWSVGTPSDYWLNGYFTNLYATTIYTTSGIATLVGSLIPAADLTYTLGSASYRWLGAYIDNLYVYGTTHTAGISDTSGISTTGTVSAFNYNLSSTSYSSGVIGPLTFNPLFFNVGTTAYYPTVDNSMLLGYQSGVDMLGDPYPAKGFQSVYSHEFISEAFEGRGDGSTSQITNMNNSYIKYMYTYDLMPGPSGLWSMDIGSQFIRCGGVFAPATHNTTDLGYLVPSPGDPSLDRWWRNGYFTGTVYCNTVNTGGTGGTLGSSTDPWNIFADILNVVAVATSLIPGVGETELALGSVGQAFAAVNAAATVTNSLVSLAGTIINASNSIVPASGGLNLGSSGRPWGTIYGSLSGNASSATTAAACSGNAATATYATSSGACSGNAATATYATSSGACSGNAATATYATTSGACSGNSATATYATTSGACSGNAATATSASSLSGTTVTVNTIGATGATPLIASSTTPFSNIYTNGLQMLGSGNLNVWGGNALAIVHEPPGGQTNYITIHNDGSYTQVQGWGNANLYMNNLSITGVNILTASSIIGVSRLTANSIDEVSTLNANSIVSEGFNISPPNRMSVYYLCTGMTVPSGVVTPVLFTSAAMVTGSGTFLSSNNTLWYNNTSYTVTALFSYSAQFPNDGNGLRRLGIYIRAGGGYYPDGSWYGDMQINALNNSGAETHISTSTQIILPSLNPEFFITLYQNSGATHTVHVQCSFMII